MVGESYIVREYDSRKTKLYGKNIKLDNWVSNTLTEKDLYQINRTKITNLVFHDDNQVSGNKLYCSLCKTRRISMTKQQLLSTYANNHQLIEKVEQQCRDVSISYAWCSSCGDIAVEPEMRIVPIRKSAVQCVKCQFSPENMGKVKTYAPKLMYENREDEDKPMGWGDNQKSSKKWYWACSLCGYREPMLKSNLKPIYVEPQSFVKSLESSLDRSRKKLLHKEDVEDIKAGLGGTPTSLVDERDI